jgi:hypothetical protein
VLEVAFYHLVSVKLFYERLEYQNPVSFTIVVRCKSVSFHRAVRIVDTPHSHCLGTYTYPVKCDSGSLVKKVKLSWSRLFRCSQTTNSNTLLKIRSQYLIIWVQIRIVFDNSATSFDRQIDFL